MVVVSVFSFNTKKVIKKPLSTKKKLTPKSACKKKWPTMLSAKGDSILNFVKTKICPTKTVKKAMNLNPFKFSKYTFLVLILFTLHRKLNTCF